MPRPVWLTGIGLALLALVLTALVAPFGGGEARTAKLAIAGPEQVVFD